MVVGIDLAEGTGGGSGGVSTTYQPRHNRYFIVSTPASSGTITLDENVSICGGYEAYAEAYEYSEQSGIMGVLIATNDPFPTPYSVSLNPTTGAFEMIDPTTGQPSTPATAFAIVYRCKTPLANWDESAPLYR